MRIVVALVLAWCSLADVHGAELKSRVGVTRISGQDYANLEDWADANQFRSVFLNREEEVKLTNRWAKLSFRINSQRAEINGVNVFLSYPIAVNQGTPWISQTDLDRTLRPILFPAKGPAKQTIRTIAISAGHGGKDSGYQVGPNQEKKYTLLLARELQELVVRAGLRGVLIRNSDKFLELEDRPRLAKREKAELFVELHYNCAGPGNSESKGVEVYCLTPAGANSTNGGCDQYPSLQGNKHDAQNMTLAYHIHSSLVGGLELNDRGIRRARFVVLRQAEMPAVLIEAGFMSQPEEMRRIADPGRRRQTAQAILDGLLAYKRVVERP
jgi:N-acetylmuramoyl-L-alanine amidase